MDICAIEDSIDSYLCKEAGYIDGDPEHLGQVATQAALYMAPVTGTLMSFKDAYNSFRNGHFWGGLGNTAVGLASGIADVFTLGTGGTAMRAALKGGKLLNVANKGRQAMRVARMMQAKKLGRIASGTVNFLRAGRAFNPVATYGGNRFANYMENRAARNNLNAQAQAPQQQFQFGNNPQQQNQKNQQWTLNMPYQQNNGANGATNNFQFGNNSQQQANVPPAKPRYGYNPQSYRYERLYS